MESAHTINTFLSQYATDNNGVYPVGEGTSAAGKSEGIARNMLENNYNPDAGPSPSVPPRITPGPPRIFGPDRGQNQLGFHGRNYGHTGLTSEAPEDLPVVYPTGETVAYPHATGANLDLAPSGSGPLGDKGVIVAHKTNNAVFIPSVPSKGAKTCPGFFPVLTKIPPRIRRSNLAASEAASTAQAAREPLTTAPSIVAGSPIMVQSPASQKFDHSVVASGRSASVSDGRTPRLVDHPV